MELCSIQEHQEKIVREDLEDLERIMLEPEVVVERGKGNQVQLLLYLGEENPLTLLC